MKAGPQIERSIAAGLVFIGIMVLGGLVLAASLADLSSALTERDAKADFVLRSLRASARPNPADQTNASGGRNLAIVADSETLAAAQLDALVRSTFTDAGSAVSSSQTEAKHDDPGLAGHIEARAVAEGSIEEIQKALFGLESGVPLVLVDELSLQSVETAGGSDSVPQAPTLRATMTLSAYWAAPIR